MTCDRGCLYFWGQELQLLRTRACITLQWEWGTAFNMFNCKAATSHCQNVCFFRLCFFFFIFCVCMCISLPWLTQTPERLVFALARKSLLNSLKTEKNREFECHWKKSDEQVQLSSERAAVGGGQTLGVVIVWGVVETKRKI